MKILVIGAHPDDYELGMSGTIMKHVAEGHEVHGIIATNGDVIGRGSERQNEAKITAKFLGLKSVTFLNMKDTKIEPNKEAIDKIEAHIKRVFPDRIYIHSVNDTHQDHRNLSRATLSAARNVKQILFYESPSSDINFVPNFFVNITNYIERKVECLRLFDSLLKLGDRRYLEIEAIKGGAFFRGYQCKVKYAEAFEVFRYLEV